FVLRGAFDPAGFAATLAALAARHPVLRTSFDEAHFSVPLQLVHRRAVLPLAVVDLRALPAAAREEARAERFAAALGRRFDGRRAPLLRFWVHLLTAHSFELGVAEHHAILDGWSLATLLSELFALAEGPAPGPPPAPVFRDFVALEQRALASPESREH